MEHQQILTKNLIDRHSKSSHQMCRYYCVQFLNFNIAAFAKLTLAKILLHLKTSAPLPHHKTRDSMSCDTEELSDTEYQIIDLF